MRAPRPVPVPPGTIIIRFLGGPWHGAQYRPPNPAGVLPELRTTGMAGAYRRDRRDPAGYLQYRWTPDSDVPPPPHP